MQPRSLARARMFSALLLVPTILTLSTAAVTQAIDGPVEKMPPAGHGVPGQLPGTEQWIVHFKTRSFDLTAFRAKIYANRPWAEVEPILADYRAKTKAERAGFTTAVERLGGKVFIEYWLVNASAIEIPFKQLDTVRGLAKVLRLAPNLPAYPLIKIATNGGNHNSDAMNLAGFKGKGITTAIVDTGLDANCGSKARPHQIFYEDGDITKTNRLLANIQVGILPPDNSHPHGTGVAGIAAGGTWQNSGADFGHAPHASIVGYSLSNSSSGGTTLAIEAKAWQFVARDAAKYKIKTANNSYSGSADPLNVSQQALDAAALNADVMICIAGGNGGSSTAGSQATINGLAVAAVNATSHTMASFSSRGPHSNDPKRFYPDISACGVSTIMPRNDAETSTYVGSGTSMATPQVCGAATLLRAEVPALTAIQTKAILLATAQDISQQNLTAPYNTRNAYGMGLLRDDGAMALAKSTSDYGTASVDTTTTTWQTIGVVKKGKTYRAVATWMRQTMTTKGWSDLNVEVFDGSTVIASSATERNLYEVAIFRARADGVVIFKVTGKFIEKGKQNFAWAFTEGSGPPVPSDYAQFGTGCPSTRAGCGTCTQRNWSQTLASKTTSSTEIAILESVYSKKLEICGIELYASSRGTTAVDVNVSIRSFNAATAKPGSILATGKVKVGAAGAYRVDFASIVSIPTNSAYIIAFDNADKIILPVSPTGTPRVHFEYSGTWGLPQYNSNWQYGIRCDLGLIVPRLFTSDKPVIGTTFDTKLRDAPVAAPTIFVVGLSKTLWGTTPLPYNYSGSCSLLASFDFSFPMVTSATGTATISLPIPNQVDLAGLVFFNQFLVANAANPWGLIASNGARGVIGEF